MPSFTLARSPQRVIALNFAGSQRIDRNIDAAHAMSGQFGGIVGQLAAIGGERQFVQRAGAQMARQAFDQRHDVLAHQRLAAGQPELAARPCR